MFERKNVVKEDIVKEALANPYIKHLLATEKLTEQPTEKLTEQQLVEMDSFKIAVLSDTGVQALLDKTILKIDDIISLEDPNRGSLLIDKYIQMLIAEQKLHIDQLKQINRETFIFLKKTPIQRFISNGALSINQVFELTNAAMEALGNRNVLELISKEILTMKQALKLTDSASKALCNNNVYDLIKTGPLNIHQVCELTKFGNRLLVGHVNWDPSYSQNICRFIKAGKLTVEHMARITHAFTVFLLHDKRIQSMIDKGRLTVPQVLAVEANVAELLLDFLNEDGRERDRWEAGEITFEAFVRVVQGDDEDDNAPLINRIQSTHTASVHKTVSQSATQLLKSYGAEIDGNQLETVIERIKDYVNQLSSDSDKHEAAKRLIRRITEPDYHFIDPSSQITTKQLLGLTFLAMHDDAKREGSLEDALVQFVEGLYEMQRGYNLSSKGIDDQVTRDKFICCAGTFNKFIEKLTGIHSDCEIQLITKNNASLKLPIVAREEAMNYLNGLASPNNSKELQAFTELISQIKESGIDVIWDQIESKIKERMFDEFGSLYQDKEEDPDFTALIEAGAYINLGDLKVFQKQIQNSQGYQQYCSKSLQQHGMFSSTHNTEAVKEVNRTETYRGPSKKG